MLRSGNHCCARRLRACLASDLGLSAMRGRPGPPTAPAGRLSMPARGKPGVRSSAYVKQCESVAGVAGGPRSLSPCRASSRGVSPEHPGPLGGIARALPAAAVRAPSRRRGSRREDARALSRLAPAPRARSSLPVRARSARLASSWSPSRCATSASTSSGGVCATLSTPVARYSSSALSFAASLRSSCREGTRVARFQSGDVRGRASRE